MDAKYQDITIRRYINYLPLVIKRKVTIKQITFNDKYIIIEYEEETPAGITYNSTTINKLDLAGKALVID